MLVASAAQAQERRCDAYAGLPEDTGPSAGMVWIAGGTFTMGDDDERPEERSAHPVTVSGFWIDRHEVTNAQFARFVDATGYRTVAERGLDPKDHPGVPPELLAPGAVVFTPPTSLRNLVDVGQWWRFVPGADWRHPSGPASSIRGRTITRSWTWPTRTRSPTRAGPAASCRPRRNGSSPPAAGSTAPLIPGVTSTTILSRAGRPTRGKACSRSATAADDGHHGTAPVGCFEPNGYGLFDMAGNVWEYTRDWWVPGHPAAAASEPEGPPEALAVRYGGGSTPSVVIKGGSWLCAPNFCARYRPAARQPQELGLGASHLGFRTVLNGPPT